MKNICSFSFWCHNFLWKLKLKQTDIYSTEPSENGQKCTETCKHTHGNLRQNTFGETSLNSPWSGLCNSFKSLVKTFWVWIKISPKFCSLLFPSPLEGATPARSFHDWRRFIVFLSRYGFAALAVFDIIAVRCFPAGTEWWSKLSVSSALTNTSGLRRSWAGWHAVCVLQMRHLLHLSPIHLQSEAKISHLDAIFSVVVELSGTPQLVVTVFLAYLFIFLFPLDIHLLHLVLLLSSTCPVSWNLWQTAYNANICRRLQVEALWDSPCWWQNYTAVFKQTKEIRTNNLFQNCDNVSSFKSPRKTLQLNTTQVFLLGSKDLKKWGGWFKTSVELVKWEN